MFLVRLPRSIFNDALTYCFLQTNGLSVNVPRALLARKQATGSFATSLPMLHAPQATVPALVIPEAFLTKTGLKLTSMSVLRMLKQALLSTLMILLSSMVVQTLVTEYTTPSSTLLVVASRHSSH